MKMRGRILPAVLCAIVALAAGCQTARGTKSADPNRSAESSDVGSSFNEMAHLQALARKHAPVFYFHPDEVFMPSSPEWFLDRVGMKIGKHIIIEPGTMHPTQDLLTQKGTVPGTGVAYDSGGAEQDSIHLFIGKEMDNTYSATAAGNVESVRCFARPHPVTKPNGAKYIDIPYAVFFPYNGNAEAYIDHNAGLDPIKNAWNLLHRIYNTTISSSLINQGGAHEGDWEHLTVRLSVPEEELVAVYYSAHGKEDSTWYFAPAPANADSSSYFAQVDGYKYEGSQLVAFSARNSHGMYNRTGDKVLRSAGMKPSGRDEKIIGWVAPYERTGFGPRLNCAEKMDVITPQDGQFGETKLYWIQFSGRWGSTPPSGIGGSGPEGLRAKRWWTDRDSEWGDEAQFQRIEGGK